MPVLSVLEMRFSYLCFTQNSGWHPRVGIWEQPTKSEALAHLAAFKAKYAQRYPEAIRSLLEDEAHLLTFYEFPASMHRHIQTTNAIESRLLPRETAHRSDCCLVLWRPVASPLFGPRSRISACTQSRSCEASKRITLVK